MYLGQEIGTGGRPGRPIGYPGDAHMLTVGPTRSGKSRRLLIPNLLYETARSMLVIDMKGELAAITGPHRAGRGGKVLALDPFGALAERKIPVQSVGFNPMRELDPRSETFVDAAMLLAEALVQVNADDHNAYFSEGAQDLVAGMIMLVRCINGPSATLGVVRRELTRSTPDIELTARAALKNANLPTPIHNKLSKFSDIKESRELPAVISTAQVQTRFLDSPAIARSLADDGIDFHRLKTENMTVYLVLPPQNLLSHAKWLRLIVSSAMTAMQRPVPQSAKNRPHVLFMLDEFPQLGKLQAVETAVALNAGFGVKVWAAVQNFGQLKALYGDNWETFLSAGCVTAFAPRDVFTRDHLTTMIGTGSKAMESLTINTDGTVSRSNSVQKDDIMAPWQWQRMILGEQRVFVPTDSGLEIRHVYGPDYTDLPEVKSGAFQPGTW